MGTGYQQEKKLWVPMRTGCQPGKSFWVPGTGQMKNCRYRWVPRTGKKKVFGYLCVPGTDQISIHADLYSHFFNVGLKWKGKPWFFKSRKNYPNFHFAFQNYSKFRENQLPKLKFSRNSQITRDHILNFFDANFFVGHQPRIDRGSQNSKVR